MHYLFRSQEICGHLRWSVEISVSHFNLVTDPKNGHIPHSYLLCMCA
jgi:hypothetical protein